MIAKGLMLSELAHQHRFENAADGDLYRSQADDKNNEWTSVSNCTSASIGGKCDADDGADIRNVVEHEDEQRPGLREVDAEQASTT